MTDAELARSVAGEAGILLNDMRATSGLIGAALGDEGDRRANDYILRRLAAERPTDSILSEESFDDQARCLSSRVWIVDPLDGTREYREGRDDWAVHVALGHLLASDDGGAPAPLPPRPRMVISRSRPPTVALAVADALGAKTIPMGSAGAKAMAVVRGDADIYLHAGGQFEWDNCAPAAVAIAHGYHASRIDGAPLVYNCPDPRLPDLLICHPALAARVLELVRAFGASDR